MNKTLEEIKDWATEHIADNNMRVAFFIILRLTYCHTEDRLNDIEKFYEWFSHTWEECLKNVKKATRYEDVYGAKHITLDRTIMRDIPFVEALKDLFNKYLNEGFEPNFNILRALTEEELLMPIEVKEFMMIYDYIIKDGDKDFVYSQIEVHLEPASYKILPLRDVIEHSYIKDRRNITSIIRNLYLKTNDTKIKN